MIRKRIAVIGAGSAGLKAIKMLKEEDFEPVCFERTGYHGGLWRYHDEDIDGLASVMKTTIINTSKEMGAISDFPPPEDAPNYMPNTEVFRYLTLYAEKFDLLKHIQYNREVVKVEFADDYAKTGRLKVTTRDTKTGETSKEVFDGVFVCTGHHCYPNIPTFPGQEKFKGKIMHTHSLKKVHEFEDLNVAVIGLGNSGLDAAVEISSVAKQVYLSTRRGAWVLPRLGPYGLPIDVVMNNRFLYLLYRILPLWLTSWVLQSSLNRRFDHAAYNLKPKHTIFSQHPTVSDGLPIKLLSGLVKIKKNVKEIKEDGIIFEDENEVTKVDSIVLATGYKIKFPFLSEELTTVRNNKVHLYKYIYPPHLQHHTLAIIGLVQSVGAGFPIGEAQCRLATLVLKGKVKLPSWQRMEVDIKDKQEENDRLYVRSERHTIQVDYIGYLDEICEMFGAKPNLLKLLFTDPRVFFVLVFGPSLPYQYRLQGPHPWPGAREAILTYKQRIWKPLKKEQSDKKQILRPLKKEDSEPSEADRDTVLMIVLLVAAVGAAIAGLFFAFTSPGWYWGNEAAVQQVFQASRFT